MHLVKLHIVNFNNYETAQVDVHSSLNIFTGLNGVGKTNLLDAIHYLCLGKSYFTTVDSKVVRHGEEYFRLEGEFDTVTGIEKVEIKVIPSKKKEIQYSGKKRKRLSDHIGALPCVIIAPVDVQMMLEGSKQRRGFLDNSIMQYDKVYVSNILQYNRLLKQRNATLRMFAENQYYDQGLIDSISVGMVKPAAYIFEARRKLVDGLSPLFEKYYGLISGDREPCIIRYKSGLVSDGLLELFAQSIEKDKILTRTNQGIHKDDIVFKMNDLQLKNFASQGQLKSFVLSLKLAQYEMISSLSGISPILMLDDIFDKLDKDRVRRLLELLSADSFGQIFITDTSRNRVADLLMDQNVDHRVYNVIDGQINKI